jgi:hypothetical protein
MPTTIPGAEEILSGLMRDLGGGGVWNPMHRRYGAKGKAVGEQSQAILDCYSEVPDGASMILPDMFRCSQKLSFNRRVNVFGFGVGTGILLDLASNAIDGVVLNDTASSLLYGVRHDNYAIVGANANACRDALVINRLNLSEINLHVKAAATRYGSRLNGCLISKFRIVSSVNVVPGYPYPTSMPANDTIRVQFDTVNGYGFNNCEIDAKVEGGGGRGLHMEDQLSQGNNTIKGCIEGTTGTRSLYAKGTIGLNLKALHIEGCVNEAELDTCSAFEVSGGTQFLPRAIDAANAPSGKFRLTACSNGKLLSGACDSLTLDAACSNILRSRSFRHGLNGGVVTDPAGAIHNEVGTITGQTAAPVGSGVATTLIAANTRGAGRYVVTAFIPNAGLAYHALADFVYDGATPSRVGGVNGALMTLTLVGNNITATQSSGGAQLIGYTIAFHPF